MRNRTLKLGMVAAAALGAALPLLATQSAYADYAPSSGDIVGVGSDTLQNMIDFIADGNAYGPTGYNQIGNKDKLISFDATADANVRLAYGVDGGQSNQSTCTPGTGSTAGTGNQTAAHSDSPCVLNPTIVLRAGLQAVQRPNGSGAGVNALKQDVAAGDNTYGVNEVINFARASAAQSPAASFGLDSVTVATDLLPMVVSSTPATHAVELNAAELWDVYQANGVFNTVAAASSGVNVNTFAGAGVLNVASTAGFPASGTLTVATSGGNATLTYTAVTATTFTGVNDSSSTSGTLATNGSVNGGTSQNLFGGQGCVTWNEIPGNATGSSDTIIPIIPQVGSGTRKYFLQQIQDLASSATPANPGTCAQVAEENDPEAVGQQSIGSVNVAADAVEPVSQGRLDLFKGVNVGGTSQGIGGYFLDPSCAYEAASSACGAGTLTPESTTVAAASNGANVATLTTLNVGSTTGFPTSGNSLTVATSAGNANFSYSGTTATSFTGVSLNGGSGTVATGGAVSLVINTYVPNPINPTVATLASASSTVTAASNGVNVNTFAGSGTLNVASSTSFAATGTVSVVTSAGFALLSYTGKTATTLTGVTDTSSTNGTLATGNAVTQGFDPNRNLYIYFRDADITSAAPWQPGTTTNWLKALFYDPCPTGASNCVTVGGVQYGPAGAPYIDTGSGQTLLQDAGVTPVNTDATGNFQQGGA